MLSESRLENLYVRTHRADLDQGLVTVRGVDLKRLLGLHNIILIVNEQAKREDSSWLISSCSCTYRNGTRRNPSALGLSLPSSDLLTPVELTFEEYSKCAVMAGPRFYAAFNELREDVSARKRTDLTFNVVSE